MRFCKLFRFLKPKPPTRSIHQLLIILRDNAEVRDGKYIRFGLCYEVDRLCRKKIISSEEFFMLYDYMEAHQPKVRLNKSHWFMITSWSPRLEWLNQQIELTKP